MGAVTQRLSSQQRTQMLARIEHAQQSTVPSGGPSGQATPALDTEYIRDQMQALIPLVKECYETTLLDRPQLEGKLTVSFTIPSPSQSATNSTRRNKEIIMSKSKTVLAVLFVSGALFSQTALAAEEATVKGALDKSVIRRVIQKHIGDVKKCYEAALEKNQNLAGRVMANFIIGADGKVTESKIEESTLHSPAAERCIADAIKTWEFPQPTGGGKVIVTYPFVLAASEPSAPGSSK